MVLRITKLRKAAGLTQTQLAVRMGVAQNSISMWEHEVILPRTRDLPRLAAVLGCSIDELFIPDPDAAAAGEEVGA